MDERVVIPGGREVRGTLDGDESAAAIVVACPPHPQHGGSGADARLRAVGGALGEHGIACLRFDYGTWDEGEGERRDVHSALAWARERFDRVGLFGYSFGASVGLQAAAESDPQPVVVSALAPDAYAADAVDVIDVPLQIVYGENDDAVDWRPVVQRARERGATVEGLPTGHTFAGMTPRAGKLVAVFLASHLDADAGG